MKVLKLVLALTFVFAIVGCNSETTEGPGTEVAPQIPAMPISAAELHKAYATNEVAADERFKGKEVRVTGKLIGVSKDLTDAIYLTIHPGTEMGELEALHAYFEDGDKAAIAALKPEQMVTFVGRVDGFLMGSVMVKECALVN